MTGTPLLGAEDTGSQLQLEVPERESFWCPRTNCKKRCDARTCVCKPCWCEDCKRIAAMVAARVRLAPIRDLSFNPRRSFQPHLFPTN